MARRNPPARWPLPKNPTPIDSICFQVPVPNDPAYIAAFKGAIYELAKAYAWQNDDAHTALICAAVWIKIFDNLEMCGQRAAGSAGAEDGADEMIRQNPDNPCELQASVDGVTWCTFADISKCKPNPPQPGDGSPQPPAGGGSECYVGELSATGLALIPFPVNTGDILSVSSFIGAGTDGAGTWYCPGGETFFAGACIGGTGHTVSGDPKNTVNHMRILWKIGSSYYDAMGGPLTVPSGVVNVQPILQVNDSSLSDNAGAYQFEVCVQNNQAAEWEHTFDFSTGLHGWVPQAIYDGGGVAGHLVLGSGVASDTGDRGGKHRTDVQMHWAGTGFNLTNFRALFNFTCGNFDDPTTFGAFYEQANATSEITILAQDMVTGNNQEKSGNIAVSSVTTMDCNITADHTSGSLTGSILLKSITIRGTGPEPTWS